MDDWLISRDDAYLYASSLIIVRKGGWWLLLVLDAGENFCLVLEWNGGLGGLTGGRTLLDPDLWSQSMGLPCTLLRKLRYSVFFLAGMSGLPT